jgi:hypothetical protein
MSATVTRKAAAPEEVRAVLKEGIEDIGDFVGTPPVQRLLEHLYALAEDERPQFVLDVVLNAEQRTSRGIEVPEDMTIQRSQFADGRPTLFCIVKKVPLAYPWQKVTITFDSR